MIAKYNSFDPKIGYNLTKGGEGVLGYTFSEESLKKKSEKLKGRAGVKNKGGKAVKQYTFDGELVAEYPSAREATRMHGFRAANISRCCSGDLKTYKGFIWILSEDFTEAELKKRIFFIPPKAKKASGKLQFKGANKKIFQYSLSGEFIKEYVSASEAARQLRCDSSLIGGAANGKLKKAKNFI